MRNEVVVAAGETESGVTVHYVTEVFDSGEIVMQQRVPVLPDDSPESLEERIHKAEYELYPRAIVAALGRIPSEEEAGAAVESESAVEASAPPAVPKSVDEEWAEVLKVRYEPSEASVLRLFPEPGQGFLLSLSRKIWLLDSRLPLCLTESLCRPRSFFGRCW